MSRATYGALFAAIGDRFGAGDGSTSFNVPDRRGRVGLGKAASGTGSTLGETGGAIDHTHSVPGLSVPGLSVPGLSVPALTVDPPDTNLSFTAVTVDTNLDGNTAGVVKTISVVPHTDIASFNTGTGTTGTGTTGTGTTGTGTSGSGNPPFIALNYIIRT